jgi:3-oxoacyl-[acyl-carrier protein] reductase
MDMQGKNAVVTGGSRGIGRAISEELAACGANIIIADIQEDSAENAAKEIMDSYGIKTAAIKVDVSDPTNAKELVSTAIKEFEHIHILVNNAGVTRDNLIMRMSDEDWDLVLNVNLKGAFNCSKAIIRPMMKQKYGRIVNISSVSGLAGQAGQTNYSASKAGMIGFTKALAREVASRKITVNAVAPGFIPTALTVDLPDEFKEWALNLTPVGRMGKPEEVAYAVAFLASEKAAYITGQVLSVDGGMMMM